MTYLAWRDSAWRGGSPRCGTGLGKEFMGINGVPHPRAGDWFSKPSGGANWSKALGGGKSKGCTVTLLGLLGTGWLLDVLLAGSKAAA